MINSISTNYQFDLMNKTLKLVFNRIMQKSVSSSLTALLDVDLID